MKHVCRMGNDDLPTCTFHMCTNTYFPVHEYQHSLSLLVFSTSLYMYLNAYVNMHTQYPQSSLMSMKIVSQ